jgi:hypothetical protein
MLDTSARPTLLYVCKGRGGMTYWQLQLLFAGAWALIAGRNILRARRLPARSSARPSRSEFVWQLFPVALFICLAIWLRWSDFTAAERARQHGYAWNSYLLPMWLVIGAFLLLLSAVISFLVEAFRLARQRSRTEAADGG